MICQWDTRRIPLPDESVDMIFSDPPYVKRLLEGYKWVGDEAARVLRIGGFVALMCGGQGLNEILRWLDDAGLVFYWLYQLRMMGRGTGVVWKHGNGCMPIATRLKHVVVYCKGEGVARTATASPFVSGGKDKQWHFWGQDVDSHRYFIDCFSAVGELVVDPMCGGGTSGVACEILERTWIVGDVDPAAVETTRRRMMGEEEPLSALPLFARMA